MVNVADKKGIVLARIPGTSIPLAHSVFGASAFILALIIGCYGHYYKIVKNGVAGYPDEWFPSVSATTGDWYPERNICQIFIALASGPRLMLCYLWYLLVVRNIPANGSKGFAKFLCINDIVRTVACGGWVYVTSSDDHDIHDIAMIVYLLCTIPHVVGTMKTAPQIPLAQKYRRIFAYTFFGALIPMVHFFIQHNIHRIPGAYTYYAFFEWSLIISDLAFDAVCLIDFQTFEFRIVDVGRSEAGHRDLKTYGGNESFIATLGGIKPFEVISFAADVYLGFVFWSMLTALPLMIWYFPLWHMGISGYEAFLFSNLSAVLLGFNFLRRGIERAKGVFHLLSLVGVISYQIADPAQRLMAVAAGVSISLMTWGATLFGQRHQSGRAECGVLTLALGLILHNVVKQAWWANNPIWPIMNENTGGQNLIGLGIGVLASLQVMLRKEPNVDEKPTVRGAGKQSESWFLTAIGSGSYLFCLHSMFTDSTTISRWSLGGYPNTGPQPVPGGLMVIAAMATGLTLSSKRRWVTSLIWWAIGSAGAAVLVLVEGDAGFAGGIVFTVYALSLFPSVFRSLARQPPGRTFFFSMLTYNILALAHVWVVAYAFVPGGEVLRERTDYVVIAMQSLLLIWAFNVNNGAWSAVKEASSQSAFSLARLYTKLSLIGLMAASIGVCYNRLPKSAPQPHHPEHKLITAGIWTIHFAIDNDMYNSELRMRDAIRDLELDVIGLLESDLQRMIMGNRDLTQFLSEDLNMYADYGPGPTKHTWGCTMLSKFPIKRSSHHLLPSPKGELACAIYATLDVYGKEVDVIVSHNGQEEDLLDRQLQTTELGRIMRESDNPFLFLGYVVTKPGKGNEIYELLMDGGRVHDVEVSDWDRWCQYLAFRGVKRVGYARVSHGGITDTEIQVGKYQLLEEHPTSWDRSQSLEEFRKEITYNKISEDQVPAGMRFPSMFYGQGIRKHRYHVFDRPYYYA